MSDFDEDGRRIPDWDELRDAHLERRRRSWATSCQCITGHMPGHCPGPANCAYAEPSEGEDE